MAISKIEQAQLDVLDLLIEEGGYWTGPDGEVLLTLAAAVYAHEVVDSQSSSYKRVSLAVLRLEQAGLVTVERRYHDEAERANIIEAIRLTE